MSAIRLSLISRGLITISFRLFHRFEDVRAMTGWASFVLVPTAMIQAEPPISFIGLVIAPFRSLRPDRPQ
jgi:hypothetical protein